MYRCQCGSFKYFTHTQTHLSYSKYILDEYEKIYMKTLMKGNHFTY